MFSITVDGSIHLFCGFHLRKLAFFDLRQHQVAGSGWKKTPFGSSSGMEIGPIWFGVEMIRIFETTTQSTVPVGYTKFYLLIGRQEKGKQ